MKTYVANRKLWGTKIRVVGRAHFVAETKTYFIDPEISKKFRNHSPDGFEWGYAGSGPTQTALAILLDLFGESQKNLIEYYYQEFKNEFIATAPGDGFVLTEEQIKNWIADYAKTCL